MGDGCTKKPCHLHLHFCDLVQTQLRVWNHECFTGFRKLIDAQERAILGACGLDLFDGALALQHHRENIANIAQFRIRVRHVEAQQLFGGLFAQGFLGLGRGGFKLCAPVGEGSWSVSRAFPEGGFTEVFPPQACCFLE